MENGHPSAVMVVLALAVVAIVVYLSYSSSHGSGSLSQNGTTSATFNYTDIQSNYTVAVDLRQEIDNATQLGYNVNSSTFYSTSISQCSRQLIAYCDNNVPEQFVCVNQDYASGIATQRTYIYDHGGMACPLFILEGNVSCGIVDNHCVVTDTARVNVT